MAKYRKTALVDAEQFLPRENKIPDGVISDGLADPRKSPEKASFVLDTLEGRHELRSGDYICTGPAGERWNVSREIFEATYELATIMSVTSDRTQLAEKGQLDPGIALAVQILADNGIETFESCEGGCDHAFFEPTVRFYGDQAAGPRAVAICIDFGLPVSELRRYWSVERLEMTGPHWEVTFCNKVYYPNSGVRPSPQQESASPSTPALDERERLRSALERLERNFDLLLRGKPVRDVDETKAEVRSALASIRSGDAG